jgi:tetratricopeptide (TPR) repeat protein
MKRRKEGKMAKEKAQTGWLETMVKDGRDEYLVITECAAKLPVISTNVYKKGELIETRRTDYGHEAVPDLDVLMHDQHEEVLRALRRELDAISRQASEYVKEIRELIRKRAHSRALELAREGLAIFPEDPALLSFFGYLKAVFEKDLKEGLLSCRQAVEFGLGEAAFYPVLYLNLGRVYALCGKKAEAVDCFMRGLARDPRNPELASEMRKFGVRKAPVISFLSRSNPVNKYLGILRSYVSSSG